MIHEEWARRFRARLDERAQQAHAARPTTSVRELAQAVLASAPLDQLYKTRPADPESAADAEYDSWEG